MNFALAAITGRILLLGIERIVVKRLGTYGDSFSSAFLFFAFGALLLWPFTILEEVGSYAFLGRVAVSSVVYAAAFVCYVKSLSIGEASLVSPLYNFNIFFLAVIAAVFLGEGLGLFKLAGLCLLVYGATFLNRQRTWWCSLGVLFQDRACRLMMAGSLLIAVGRVIDKYNMAVAPPVTYCFTLYCFVSAYLLILIIWKRRVGRMVRLVREQPGLSITAGAINGLSYLFLLIALKDLEVSVAEPVSMLGMVVTVILSKFMFGEYIRQRMLGVVVMTGGAWLLFLA